MSEKSRVILYADLRKKISDIDAYSFDDKSLSSLKNADKILEEKDEDISLKSTSSGIMRNTFSMSMVRSIKTETVDTPESSRPSIVVVTMLRWQFLPSLTKPDLCGEAVASPFYL